MEGNWVTVALLKDGQEQKLLDSNISFKAVGTNYNAKGLAGVNLFSVFVENNGYHLKREEEKPALTYFWLEEEFRGKGIEEDIKKTLSNQNA